MDVDIPADLPDVAIDGRLLELVVGNLLDNALKFSPSGASCHLQARLNGSEVVIQVEDHGIGIAPEHLGWIFDRFYQVDASSTRSHGGVGLGLHLVRTIVEEAGGTVEVRSEVDRGTRFTVLLPIHEAPIEAETVDHDIERSSGAPALEQV